jgi:hypothetical protein
MSSAMGAREYVKVAENTLTSRADGKDLAMMKLNSDRYRYKFALITKERSNFGKSVWRCSLTNTIRNFPSRRNAERFVDDVEVNLACQGKRQNSYHQPPFETFDIDLVRSGSLVDYCYW